VAESVAAASRFAEDDPYRAATHNKGIMNGVDAVVMATGNDWRGVEAARTPMPRATAAIGRSPPGRSRAMLWWDDWKCPWQWVR